MIKPFLLAGTPVEVHTMAPIKLGNGGGEGRQEGRQ